MTTAIPHSEIVSALARASVSIAVDYEGRLNEVDISQYDCLFVCEFSNKNMTVRDCQKVVDFVKKGGGVFIGLRGSLYQSYGEGQGQTDWEN